MSQCPLGLPEDAQVEELVHLDVQGDEGNGGVELLLFAPLVESLALD